MKTTFKPWSLKARKKHGMVYYGATFHSRYTSIKHQLFKDKLKNMILNIEKIREGHQEA